jgi:hypothetical protein
MSVGLDPISLGETARSISKARMSVKSSALVLIHRHQQRRFKKKMNMLMIINREENLGTHSTSENRKPIQARGPPMNVNWLAQTPGTEETASGIFSQRSGLEKNQVG